MKPNQNDILQLKITLNNIEPPIWRRIQLPGSCTFWGLHLVIQDAMGWSNSHLHEFLVTDSETGQPVTIGIPDDERLGNRLVLSGQEVPLIRYLRPERPWATYIYDLGDGWTHTLLLENILPKDKDQRYPLCLAGERACPPEDCGGPPGYEAFLRAIRDPRHEEHKAMLQWVGGSFDPETFDPIQVQFKDL